MVICVEFLRSIVLMKITSLNISNVRFFARRPLWA